MTDATRMRLQKYLAQCGIASRRKAEEIIKAGRVQVDGLVVREMGVRIDPHRQRVLCDGKAINREERKVYILLHKPTGYVTTACDTHGRPTVLALVQDISERIFPVGRLDMDTSGALLLTNDGEFAHKILHPRFQITRTYLARVQGTPDNAALDRLRKGIVLDATKTAPAQVRLLSSQGRYSQLEIILHEGKKRQVRRMCEAIGHRVVALKRLAYGGLTLGNTKPGSFRFLSTADLRRLLTDKKKQTKKTLYK